MIFLLSIGADPTESIEGLARKRKLPGPAVISMGEGQEPVAIKAMQTGDSYFLPYLPTPHTITQTNKQTSAHQSTYSSDTPTSALA